MASMFHNIALSSACLITCLYYYRDTVSGQCLLRKNRTSIKLLQNLMDTWPSLKELLYDNIRCFRPWVKQYFKSLPGTACVHFHHWMAGFSGSQEYWLSSSSASWFASWQQRSCRCLHRDGDRFACVDRTGTSVICLVPSSSAMGHLFSHWKSSHDLLHILCN